MKIVCTVVVVLLLAAPSSHAFSAFTNDYQLFQQFLQELLATLTGGTDKKAAAAVKSATTTLNKADETSLAKSSKALSTAMVKLSSSSVSNQLGASMVSVLDTYHEAAVDQTTSSSNALNLAFASGPQRAATRGLATVQSLLNATNENVPLRARTLATATRKLDQANMLIAKALSARPPKSHFTATISGQDAAAAKFSPAPTPAAASLASDGLLTITGTQTTHSGRAPNTITTTRALTLVISNVVGGTATYTNAAVSYVWSQETSGVLSDGSAYVTSSASVTVTVNTNSQVAVGTFSFSATEQNDAAKTVAANNGSFSIRYP